MLELARFRIYLNPNLPPEHRPHFNSGMPVLTRRRSRVHRQEYWLIYYGDVHVGTIAERTGNPHDAEPWEWRCGFYPGSSPGECTSGTAAASNMGLEGLVSKRRDRPYRGGPSPHWVKVKNRTHPAMSRVMDALSRP